MQKLGRHAPATPSNCRPGCRRGKWMFRQMSDEIGDCYRLKGFWVPSSRRLLKDTQQGRNPCCLAGLPLCWKAGRTNGCELPDDGFLQHGRVEPHRRCGGAMRSWHVVWCCGCALEFPGLSKAWADETCALKVGAIMQT